MHPKYICPHHRDWLFRHPESAKSYMHSAMETALYFRERGMRKDALPYQGSAYETANILLAFPGSDPRDSILAFTSNAIMLSKDLANLGAQQHSIDTLAGAHQRLSNQCSLHMNCKDTLSCIRQCIEALVMGENHRRGQPQVLIH